MSPSSLQAVSKWPRENGRPSLFALNVISSSPLEQVEWDWSAGGAEKHECVCLWDWDWDGEEREMGQPEAQDRDAGDESNEAKLGWHFLFSWVACRTTD